MNFGNHGVMTSKSTDSTLIKLRIVEDIRWLVRCKRYKFIDLKQANIVFSQFLKR